MLVLASLSPRRRELIRIIDPGCIAVAPLCSESIALGTPPDKMVEELALRKARSVTAHNPSAAIVGADTVVVLDDVILGKPAGEADAVRMLNLLSGRTHRVCTGVAVLYDGGQSVFHKWTDVTFRPLAPEEIAVYVAAGEPMDKAGAYGIQQQGALFVREIRGDYFNVVGLPICDLALALKELDVPL